MDYVQWGTGTLGVIAGAGHLGLLGTSLATVGLAAGSPVLATVAIGAGVVVVGISIARWWSR